MNHQWPFCLWPERAEDVGVQPVFACVYERRGIDAEGFEWVEEFWKTVDSVQDSMNWSPDSD